MSVVRKVIGSLQFFYTPLPLRIRATAFTCYINLLTNSLKYIYIHIVLILKNYHNDVAVIVIWFFLHYNRHNMINPE